MSRASVVLSLLVVLAQSLVQPADVHAACTPNRTAASEMHLVGMHLGANAGVTYTALKATFELNEPYVHAGTSYMYLGLTELGDTGTVNFGLKKSSTSGNWIGYIYLRNNNNYVYPAFTFDPFSYDSGGTIWLEVRKDNDRWRFYAGGQLIHTSDGLALSQFDPTQSYAYGKIENRRSQMPGGTSDHTSVTNAWYWTNVGNASWSGTPVGYNTTYFGFTESPFEFWDKYCPS